MHFGRMRQFLQTDTLINNASFNPLAYEIKCQFSIVIYCSVITQEASDICLD
jgi:hypothetical protein